MNKTQTNCPICDGAAKQADATTGDFLEISCPECGEFQISRTFLQVVKDHPVSVRRQSLERAKIRARYGLPPLVTSYDLP
ncbi:hypothetical protein [Nitratireductor thuwali]|uniref:Transcription factor zinc-finger domain-containing protein n=1 Tax=Nitratireductor thuwali TaxID=2267699 RepID=A0ABY5MNG9_9HYPH|nr:hypothetical protein NTH_02854 [Nitratireductor thuwali]